MVAPVEFELEDPELVTDIALGKLVKRVQHTFHQQPDRQQLYAVIITMQSIKVFQFIKQPNAPVQLERSGAQVHNLHIVSCLHYGHICTCFTCTYVTYECATVLSGCHVELWCRVADVAADAAVICSLRHLLILSLLKMLLASI